MPPEADEPEPPPPASSSINDQSMDVGGTNQDAAAAGAPQKRTDVVGLPKAGSLYQVVHFHIIAALLPNTLTVLLVTVV